MQGVDDQQEHDRIVDRHHGEFGARHHRIVFWAAVILLAAAIAASPLARRAGVPVFLATYALATAAWLALVPRRTVRLGTVFLLGFLLRLSLVAQDPLLSPDIVRYRWDGRALLSGFNPYSLPPSDARLTQLRDESFHRIEHRDIRSVYPPWAQLLFAGWAALGGSVAAWRAILLLFEALTAILLFRLSPSASLLYAASPLVVLEGFWSGHVDLAAAALLVAGCVTAAHRAMASGLLLALATGIKLIPLAAVPALSRLAGWRLLFPFALGLGIPLGIFAANGGVMTGLVDYSTRWSFNSPIFETTESAVRSLRLDLMLKSMWTAVKDPLQLEFLSDAVYRGMYPDFMARGILALAALSAIVLMLRKTSSHLSAAAHGVGLLILLSPTIHPWYWLCLLPLALAIRNRFWVTLAIASPASYLLYSADASRLFVYALAYGPALAVLMVQVSSGLRARDISRWMAFRGDSPS
jgi:hypothetical protein